jgi:hypothetical protein
VSLVRTLDEHFIPASRRRLVVAEARVMAAFFLIGFASSAVLSTITALVFHFYR